MHKFRLYQRKKGKQKNWLVTWTDPQGKSKTVSTGTQDELIAEKFLNAFKTAHSFSDTITCGEIINAYCTKLAERQEPKNKIKTLSYNKKLLKYFEFSNPYDLEKDLMEYENEQYRNGNAETTIARDLSVLKSALIWATTSKSGRLLNQMPYNVEVPTKRFSRDRYLQKHEIASLIKAIKTKPDYVRLTIGLALTTAQRLGAILNLKKGAVKLDSNHIDFNYGIINDGIKRKGRSICVIDDSISKLIKEAILKSQSGYLIEKDGKPLKGFYTEFKNVLNEAGIEDFRFHDFRTTWASQALQNGVPMIEITYQLAHSSVRITENHYAKFPEATRKNASNHTRKMYKGKSF